VTFLTISTFFGDCSLCLIIERPPGIQFIRAANQEKYSYPFILFTGRGSYDVDLEAMQAGATLYLTKGETSPLLLERAIRYAIEIKHNEMPLHASEARLRSVLQALVEGVVFLNPQGVVEDLNEAVVRNFGHTLQELSDPLLDPRTRIIRSDGSPFPVDDQPAIVALRTGEAVRDIELGVKTADGKTSWRLVNAQPVYDDDNTLMGAVASFFDISERKQVETALKESEEKYRTFFDQLLETVFIFHGAQNERGEEIDWVYQDVNQAGCQLLGLPRDQIIGKTYGQLLGMQALHSVMAEYTRIFETGKPSRHETTIKGKKILISLSRLDQNRGAAVGLDISQRNCE
jgi:PAS domain S-box-containing protein